MNGHGEKRSRRQDLLVIALLTEPSIVEAAKKAGISTNTAFNWLKNPEFQQRYREARQKVVDQAITQIQKAAVAAVDTLLDVMNDANSSAAARVSASKTILDHTLRAHEMDVLAARIEQIEQAIEADLRLVR